MNNKIELKCRNCGTKILVSKSTYKKIELKILNNESTPCIICSNGATFDIKEV